MANGDTSLLRDRLKRLHGHLTQENPVLADAVQSFQQLDRVVRRLGMIGRGESLATGVSWWPVIAVLGTFSSGKSTFINQYVGKRLQSTGNQAVDDRFTVICYGNEAEPRMLPGLALDSDPRFPFYQMSQGIEQVMAGEGRRLDSYLQLKTCRSEPLRGKIFIDSPGFDADAQRTSTLHMVNHIIDLSDLVLVFFDARHPEPGAMHDTLEHLVGNTIRRPDASKFLYILNQIDTTAREDNPEEVFGAWQRSLASKGLTAGRFFRIYDPDAAVPIEDAERRRRFEAKREQDVNDIYQRISQVEVERSYRVIGVLEKTAKRVRDELVPALTAAKSQWRRRVLWADAAIFGSLVLLALGWSAYAGYWSGLSFTPPWQGESPVVAGVLGVLTLIAVVSIHFIVRNLAARSVLAKLRRSAPADATRQWLVRAFEKSTAPWRTLLFKSPAGWGYRSRRQLHKVLTAADTLVQKLNDRFTNPSGAAAEQTQQIAPAEARSVPPTEDDEPVFQEKRA
jgi:GTPase SAR1 family protein